MKVSVVTTVLDEAANIGALLQAVLSQEGPLELIVVDAGSSDGTVQAVQATAAQDDRVHLFQRPGCTRGEGFRAGAAEATGDAVAFIGGDDRPAPGWLHALRDALKDHPIVVAAQEMHGPDRFARMQQVPLYVEGQDISHPGSLTAYRREVLDAVGNLDARFVTAEDMDLNLRAVKAGYTIALAPEAVIHRGVRSTARSFLRQQFWNGYGRRQLERKHGPLLPDHSLWDTLRTSGAGPWSLARLAVGGLGYLWGALREPRSKWKE